MMASRMLRSRRKEQVRRLDFRRTHLPGKGDVKDRGDEDEGEGDIIRVVSSANVQRYKEWINRDKRFFLHQN